MKIALFVILFVVGLLFFDAAHIPAWFLGAGRPTEPLWKTYAIIGASIFSPEVMNNQPHF
ncbi:hypothetical protein ACFLW6_04590 [Chloroflexota bacterium]